MLDDIAGTYLEIFDVSDLNLITNLSLQFENSKWRIQYGGPKCK